jgi:hypothetical protein
MKKVLPLAALGLMLAVTPAYADKVRDWHDLEKVHNEVLRALDHMQKAQAANHYDMGGHAAKAEADLRNVEAELKEGIEFIKNDKTPQ